MMIDPVTSFATSLNNDLTELQRRIVHMQALHKHAFVHPTATPPVTPPAPTSKSPPPFLSREELLFRILSGVEKHAGIQSNDALRTKLLRIMEDHRGAECLKRLADGFSPSGWEGDWQTLVERLTVHETYFNRDRAQLELVRREVIAPLIEQERKKAFPRLRLWSAATSTGEETYTLAMIVALELLRQGEAASVGIGEVRINPRWTITILGTDISRAVLRHAEEARYCQPMAGKLGPFRDISAEFSGFFDFMTPEGNKDSCGKVRAGVRQLTSFRQHNLVTDPPPIQEADLILCRNVMIYFDEKARIRVQKNLLRALKPGGSLVLGPSDVNLLPESYVARWSSRSVYYIKKP